MYYSGYVTRIKKWRGLLLWNYIWVWIFLRCGTCFFPISNPMHKPGLGPKWVFYYTSQIDYLVLIHNKQDAVVFNLFFKETLKFDSHIQRLWKDIFLESKFMSICSGSWHGSQHHCWRMLSKTHAQKAWRSMNQEVTGRQICSQTQSNVAPSVDVSASLAGSSLWCLSEKRLKKSILPCSTGWQRVPRVEESLGQERRGSLGAGMPKVRDR